MSVASFLLRTKGLSKFAIGEYLSEPDPYNQAVLLCYTSKFDFKSEGVD
jgi:Sec7-like guanine-nucleotide exchange factor